MNARITLPTRALCPTAGQARLDGYRDRDHTDIRKTFAREKARLKRLAESSQPELDLTTPERAATVLPLRRREVTR